jgi:hypothetical protein
MTKQKDDIDPLVRAALSFEYYQDFETLLGIAFARCSAQPVRWIR